MVEPEKPFACTMPDCGMTFTNEDHLNVHNKKHDMVLQFGSEQKAAVFVADQTPTPTRFIRNCEEVGLFQDLQNVNPFDEGFKRAIETKQGILSLEHGCCSTEELHTPQMYPLLDPGDAVYTHTNNQRNITISRSSSDENGAIKEFETTRISKLTNEVTTISRIVEKHEDAPKTKDTSQKNSVLYTNNIIKIHSNVEIRKDTEDTVTRDGVIKDGAFTKDTYDRLQVEVPQIMSQKSIDLVVDSLTSDYVSEKVREDSKNTKLVSTKDVNCTKEGDGTKDCDSTKEAKTADAKNKRDGYEVILKLPSGQQIKLINAEEAKEKPKNTKDLLKKVLTEKVEFQKLINNINVIPNVIPTISSGTLIPVSIVNTNYLPKVPLKVIKKPLRRRGSEQVNNGVDKKRCKDTVIVDRSLVTGEGGVKQKMRCGPSLVNELDSRSAASRRYRARLKETMARQAQENKVLRDTNDRLAAEKAALKALIVEHMRRCHCAEDIRELQEKIFSIEAKD